MPFDSRWIDLAEGTALSAVQVSMPGKSLPWERSGTNQKEAARSRQQPKTNDFKKSLAAVISGTLVHK